MKTIFKIYLASLIILSCSSQKKQEITILGVRDLADLYVSNIFKFNPEAGTHNGIDNANHAALSDNSMSGLKAKQEAEDSLYNLVLAVSVQELSKNDFITYNILKENLESSINTRVCRKHLWTINQINAFYLKFRRTANTQPVGDSLSRIDAIARWKKIPQYINNDLNNNREGMETGYALPKVIIQKVISQLDQLISSPIESNLFYIPVLRDSSIQFKNDIKALVEGEIMPAIGTYKEFLENEYLDNARTELTISSIPEGAECYEASLSRYTTLAEKPEVIFQWGEEAIAIRESTIVQIGNTVYGESNITAIQKAFKADKSNYFTSREEILEAAQAAISRAKDKVPDFFGLIPTADVILEPIPELEEKTGYSRYLSASDDGSRAATYMQQTFMPETRLKGRIESTAFHETYPGHHLQVGIRRELVTSHPITKYVGNSGFSEGWARYTETLADEMGLYTSEKSKLAMLMALPIGMVVDPGIHFKNWTREEAIQYTLQKITFFTREDAERYVDRISVLPGQMTTYGVGEMYFMKIRENAEEQLGEKFDIKEFHDQCLKNGSVPLNFVKNEIEKWILNKKN